MLDARPPELIVKYHLLPHVNWTFIENRKFRRQTNALSQRINERKILRGEEKQNCNSSTLIKRDDSVKITKQRSPRLITGEYYGLWGNREYGKDNMQNWGS